MDRKQNSLRFEGNFFFNHTKTAALITRTSFQYSNTVFPISFAVSFFF